MKKMLLFIILFFISIYYVKAETFYGEYRLVDDYGIYKDDLLKIETVKLYNTYNLKYIDMGYMLENNKFIKDINDYKEEYIPIDESELGDEYVKVRSSDKNTYMIQFRNFESNIKIYEVEIYYKNRKLSYGFINNPKKELANITDNNYFTFIDTKEISSFYVNLYNHYNIKDISIKIYTNELDSEFILSIGDISSYITLHNNKNKHIITFNNGDNETQYEFMGFKKIYRYYKEEKEVLNSYVEYGNNLILEDYIEFDIYYIRDKLILNDIMIINNNNQKVEDFIEYGSDKVNVECDINYGINGKYTCKYILNDITVKRDIVVNIPNIEEVKHDEINNNQIYDDANYMKTTFYESVDLKNKIDVNLLKNNNSIKPKKYKVNNHKYNLLKYIKYIIIFNLIIIEIILFIKKKKK